MNFAQALQILKRYPPKWGICLANRNVGADRIGELGATSDPRRLKNYAIPLTELQYYEYIIGGRRWFDDMRLRYSRRGLRVPASLRWLHYILPEMRTTVTETDETGSPNCGNARKNNGNVRSFRDGNIFQLFPVVSGDPNGFIERQNAWGGGSLVFRQEADPTAAAYNCWDTTWYERNYFVRWLNQPQAFWDEVLSNLCARSGSDSPCCTENIVGLYVDGWNSWFSVVRGGPPQGIARSTSTPILPADRYSTAQAHEAYRQFVYQLRRILREMDAARELRPPDYVPEIVTNTYQCAHLSVSTNPDAYSNPYVIPADGYLSRTYYINRNSSGYEFYANPDRRSDGILVEEWCWKLRETQLIAGRADQTGIYKSAVSSGHSLDARILFALRHGLKVFLRVSFAASKDDYEEKVIQIAKFWNQYRTQFPNQIYFMEPNHSEGPVILDTGQRLNFVPYNGNPRDRRAGYPQPVSRLLRWNYDENPQFRPIKLTLDDGEDP